MPNTPLRAGAVHGEILRVTRLTNLGAPLSGATSCYTTNNLNKFDFNPEIQAGAEATATNARGELCLIWRGQDVMKRLTHALEVCDLDVELAEILAGGIVQVQTAADNGFQMPKPLVVGSPNGVGIEIWSKQVVNGALIGYWHHVFPRVYLTHGNKTIDGSPMALVFNGWGTANPNFATGPVASTDATAYKGDTSSMWQVEKTATLPVSVDGYGTVA